MIVTDARRAANQRNAQRSTGPKTESGKQAVRRNALKHGLAARTVAVEDPEVHRERSLSFSLGERPDSAWVAWLADEVATITLRLDLVAAMDREARGLASVHAATTWDEDRRVEAEKLGARLEQDPGRVVAHLRQTPHGCEWLIARWTAVADRAARFLCRPSEPRTADQRRLPDLLLGKPVEASEPTSTDGHDDPWYRSPHHVHAATQAAHEAISELHRQRDRVAPADQATRAVVEAGLAGDSTVELRRIRRYESALHKRLNWCLAQVRERAETSTPVSEPLPPPLPDQESPASRPASDSSQESTTPAVAASDPAPLPGPEPVSTDPATAADPSSLPPSPAGSPRHEARLHQAETRRSSKRRKLDRRRA